VGGVPVDEDAALIRRKGEEGSVRACVRVFGKCAGHHTRGVPCAP
jgi:hypothetical protein